MVETDSKVEFKSTYPELENFVDSNVWADILSVLETKLENNRMQLENPGLDEIQSNMIRGRIREIRELMILPKVMLEDYEARRS